MFTYASKKEGQRIIAETDEYLGRISSFERSLKLKTQKNVSEEEFILHLKSCVLDWSDEDRSHLMTAAVKVESVLNEKQIYVPEQITLVKTDGRDEWNSAYTRESSIFLSPKKLKYESGKLARLLLHEIFHVIFRQREDVHESLYNLIGFHLINEIDIPDSLKSRKLTNPDGPKINSRFEFCCERKLVSAAPVILLKEGLSAVDTTEDILNSISIKLMMIERSEGLWRPALQNGEPRILEPEEIKELRNTVGQEFEKSPDPNEILAELFVRMMLSNFISSPVDLTRLKQLLQKES